MVHGKEPKDDPWGHSRSILIQSLAASHILKEQIMEGSQ